MLDESAFAATYKSNRKTMPHCALGPLRVTIRPGRPGAFSIPGLCEIILEGQCASRARLRITQCKRFT